MSTFHVTIEFDKQEFTVIADNKAEAEYIAVQSLTQSQKDIMQCYSSEVIEEE